MSVMTSMATVAAGVVLYLFDPAGTWWFPSCPFHALTGWLCPLCGSLRAVHALLHGDPLVALGLNPLTTLAVVSGVVTFAIDTMRPSEQPCVGRLARFGFSAPVVVVVLTFGVLRNLVK